MPPTATRTPASRAISPTRVVTVDLALEPVMAAMGARASRTKSAISPTRHGSPVAGRIRPASAWSPAACGSMPGLSTTSSAASRSRASRGPRCTATPGWAARKSSSPGGASRVSATMKGTPRRARWRQMARPESPRPTTRVVPGGTRSTAASRQVSLISAP